MDRTARITRAFILAIIVLLLMVTAFTLYNSIRLSNLLDKERLEKESILSEKIHLNRNLEELQKEMKLINEKK